MATIPRPPVKVVAVALVVLAINATVIQTIQTEDSPLKNLVRVSVLGLVAATLAVRNTRIPVWLLVWVLTSVALLAARGNSDQLSLIFVAVLALLLTQLDERKMLGAAAVASIIGVVLIFVFLAAGLTSSELVVNKSDIGKAVLRSRNNFGTASVPFVYNAVFGACVLSILYARKYWTRGRFQMVLIAAVAFATWMFRETDGRGGYASLLIFVILLVVVPMTYRVSAPIAAAVPALLAVASILLAVTNSTATYQLNQLLSYRPRLWRRFLEDTSPADLVLSKSVKQIDYIVDNSWLHLLVGGGVVALVVFVVLFYRAVTTLGRDGRYPEIAFLGAVCVYATTESLLVRIENVFIVITWALIVKYGGIPSTEDRASVSDEAPSLELSRYPSH